jgi:16S rRNA (adenine1518-N6/adenine1519-N6)-dimethyltransferase
MYRLVDSFFLLILKNIRWWRLLRDVAAARTTEAQWLSARLPSKQRMAAKPRLGQNFLVDPQAVERIAAALGNLSGRTVAEIGPGQGAITGALAGRAAHVIAIELDRELAFGLRRQFAPERVTVVEQDVLGFDFTAAARQTGAKLAVAGNLPYYITSPILLKLAASHAALDTAVLMIQREVADRVIAVPGSRDYGVLSVTVQMYGPAERLFTLPPSAFSPAPEVHSSVFRWRFAPRFSELDVEEAGFLRMVCQVFAQKRKTLANNLRAAGIAPGDAAQAMSRAGIDARARAEELSIETLARLWIGLASPGATRSD